MNNGRADGARGLIAIVSLIAVHGCGELARAGDPASIDTWPSLTLQEELRVGSVQDPEAGFSDIYRIAVDHEGLVYVLERREREVRVYSPEGERVRVIGGPGQGPGEFEFRIGAWFGLVGDTLWVTDFPLGRVTLFRRDGSLLSTVSLRPNVLPAPEGYGMNLLPGSFRHDGLITSAPFVSIPPGLRRPVDVTLDVPTVRLDVSGAIVDTIRVSPFHVARGVPRISIDGRDVPLPPLPAATPFWMDGTESQDVYVIERPMASSSADATVTVTKMAGPADTLFRRELRYQPEPFTEAYLASIIEPAVASHVSAVRGQQPGADSAAVAAGATAALRNAYDLPPFAPPISSARVGDDGALWLRRQDLGLPQHRWLVMGSDGRPIGQLEIPRTVSVLWSSGEVLWASALDELGVPWLVRYRFTP